MEKDRQVTNKKESSHNTKKPSSPPTEGELKDIGLLQDALNKEKEKSERYLANWQRAQADSENYKKRTEQEKESITKFANMIFILNLLPIIDDMDRALNSIPHNLKKLSWIDGFELIYRKFKAAMENQGLAEIEALGETFDPSLHEAIAHTDGEEDKVIDVTQKGYTLNGKILRPAMVIVGRGKSKANEVED
ncbi:MAG: nucleotide exchange factor GrpE [Dehalococcoidia bacterium]|nr:nucleotide exchange factor GrpE [Dehalococcoidia bacterium]